MKIAAGILLSMTVCSFAQGVKPKTPPTIPVEAREKFFKAQAEYQGAAMNLREATASAQTKNATLQQQMDVLKTACGNGYHPNVDKDGELICTEIPKAPVAPVKK